MPHLFAQAGVVHDRFRMRWLVDGMVHLSDARNWFWKGKGNISPLVMKHIGTVWTEGGWMRRANHKHNVQWTGIEGIMIETQDPDPDPNPNH